MDKIDLLLLRFAFEKTNCKEYKKLRKIAMFPLTIILLLIISLCGYLLYNFSIVIFIITSICILLLYVFYKISEGKWGTKKWKSRYRKINRLNFKRNQNKLLEIIHEEKMTPQQVYNNLMKKNDRIPKKEDDKVFVIAFLSLAVTVINILVSSLQKEPFKNHFNYCMAVGFVLAPLLYILYQNIEAQTKHNDRKKKEYESIIKILEDYLY